MLAGKRRGQCGSPWPCHAVSFVMCGAGEAIRPRHSFFPHKGDPSSSCVSVPKHHRTVWPPCHVNRNAGAGDDMDHLAARPKDVSLGDAESESWEHTAVLSTALHELWAWQCHSVCILECEPSCHGHWRTAFSAPDSMASQCSRNRSIAGQTQESKAHDAII